MKKYDSYKDSGIEWIGEIPGHWDVMKFGYLFSFSRGLGITKQDLLDEGVPCVNYGEIHSKYGFRVAPEINQLKCVQESYLETSDKSLLRRGDFVFADTSEDIEGSGNFTCLDSDTPTFAGYHTVIARSFSENNYLFLAYYFDSLEYRNQIRNLVSGIKVYSITQAILKNTSVLLPPPLEQIAIANYLDRKTAEIDELIADKKRLLELYEEEKTAIINQAVTKGINPDSKMKDSGIEWLGEIPERWEVKRLKHLSSLISKGTTPSTVGRDIISAGDVRFIKAENIVQNQVSSEPENFIDFETNQILSRSELVDGDILFVIAGATLGKIAILKTDLLPANTNQAISFIRLKNKSSVIFIWYYLQSITITRIIWLNAVQSAQPNLSMENIGNFYVPFPSFEEQQAIVHHIETECARIDAKKSRTEKLIELLTEFRTALISEIVTGKIKVVD